MFLHKSLIASLLALASIATAQATQLPINADGKWNLFDVVDPQFNLGNSDLSWVDIDNNYSNLSFTFNIAAGEVGTLTVVDGGFSGDRFSVLANGVTLLGNTSAAVNSYPTSIGLDFDAALANPDYSRGVFTLGAGSYSVTGSLFSSALDDTGAALNSTVGALKLEVSPVPDVTPLTALMAGLGILGFVASRRRAQ